MAAATVLVSVLLAFLLLRMSVSVSFSSKLIHRFSDEAKALIVSRNVEISGQWPKHRSMEYYQLLLSGDLQRQDMKLGARYQSLFPSEGSRSFSLGNDFGWLHYMWVDVGTPNVSFLVALDAGSDLFWVPCDCLQCASLSARYYNMDRELNLYSPSESSTSKHLSCNHQLCHLAPSCKSSKQPCSYLVTYYSANTSTSGFLVEDILHLASSAHHSPSTTVKTPVIIGCGQKQSGGFLSGIAPDGLLGLGFGDISVPSFLAKAGLVRDSFSMCFEEDSSGNIIFGDQEFSLQQSTPFLTLEGKYVTYVVGVSGICVGITCPKGTNFRALVDSGSSFTFLPKDVYERVIQEFDEQINFSRVSYEGSLWDYCYKASTLDLSNIPSVTLTFVRNTSFTVQNPIFPYFDEKGELDGFCLALQSAEGNLGTIGNNLMMGYRMVFDRENMKLGWSRSNCHNRTDETTVSITPPPHDVPENPLPTNEQQSSPGGHAVSPAVASRTPPNQSAVTILHTSQQFCLLRMLPLILAVILVG